MFLPHRQAGQPALRLPGLPAYAAKTPRSLRQHLTKMLDSASAL